MLTLLLGVSLAILLLYCAMATIYLLALATAYWLMGERTPGPDEPLNRFAVLVPAHNEELLIATLCRSLTAVNYPPDRFTTYIVADNCTDGTVDICREQGLIVLERHDPREAGKGQALAWALRRIPLDQVDAVFIVDADSYVEPNIFSVLNPLLNSGEKAIQCANVVSNPDDSWFTRLLHVSRTINNALYHEAKSRLGLSSYLMGNGMCFSIDLLRRKGWTAFSIGEDWEYYAQLVGEGIKISFAYRGRIFLQESRSLNQATSQRLRWSSGRFAIARALGLPLLFKGLRDRNWIVLDASLPLLFPNYSLQINLTLVGLALSAALSSLTTEVVFVTGFLLLLGAQFLLFLAGALIAGAPWKTFLAALHVPVFLAWKLLIDFLCITGLYRGDRWVRTRRHVSK